MTTVLTNNQIESHLLTLNLNLHHTDITHFTIHSHDPSGEYVEVHLEHPTHPDVLDIIINLALPFGAQP